MQRTLSLAAVVVPAALAISCGGSVSGVPGGDAGSPATSGFDAARAGDDGGAGPGAPGTGLQAGAPWPMFGQRASLRARSAFVGPAAPTVKWIFPAAGPPAVGADGTIYFGTGKGVLYALGPDGSSKWTFSGGDGVSFGGTPAILADGTVLIGARSESRLIGQLFAVSPTGALEWTYDTTRSANGAVPIPSVGADGTIYLSVAYHLYAIHPDGSAAWQANAGDEYTIVPAIGPDGTVYVGGQYGLQAFTPEGHGLWAFGPCADEVSECTSQPAVADDGTIVTTVVAPSSSSDVSLLTAVRSDGAETWSLGLPRMGLGYALAGDGTILFTSMADVESVAAAGRVNWTSTIADASSGGVPLLDAAGNVYVGGVAWNEIAPCGSPCEGITGGGLHAYRPDGTVAWELEPGLAFDSPVLGADGTLYVAAIAPEAIDAGEPAGLYAIGR